MKKWSLQEALDNISSNIRDAKTVDIESLIVEADSSKGFNYPYLLIYPQSNMRNTLVIDCLNDYEKPMSAGMIDRLTAIKTKQKGKTASDLVLSGVEATEVDRTRTEEMNNSTETIKKRFLDRTEEKTIDSTTINIGE